MLLRLDLESAEAWCESLGIGVFPNAPPASRFRLPEATESISLALPTEGLRVVDFANWILVLDDVTDRLEYDKVLIWLLDWDIWSVERERVGVRLLHALLGDEQVKERPAIEFRTDELTEAQALIALVVLFQWDAVILPSHGEYAVTLSHHGKAEIRIRAPDARIAISEGVRKFEQPDAF